LQTTTSRANEVFGVSATLTTRLHRTRDSALPLAKSRGRSDLTRPLVAAALWARTNETLFCPEIRSKSQRGRIRTSR
jgi:hypothetical protein